ncbi:MAG: chemotaxis protein CheW [Desulforhopalus sp.]
MSSVLDLENLIQNIDGKLAKVSDMAEIAEQQAAADREEMNRYILVGIGALHLAIAINDLSEVGPLPAITALPNLPQWVQGIVNIRSDIVSVIDLGGFLRVADKGVCDGHRLAVVRHNKQKIGIRVDRIIGTVNKAVSETKPLDFFDKNPVDKYLFTTGLFVDKNFYYILDVPRFLTAPRLVNYNGKG